MNDQKFNIGDKVYFIKTFDEVYWRSELFKPPKTKYPIEKKITQVVKTKNGILYQVKGGHFDNSWIDRVVFTNKEDAQKALKNIKE